jgi:chromosome segregation ATPase
MSDDEIRIEIEGDEGSTAKREPPAAEARAARAEAEALHWRRQAAIERTARVAEVADRDYDTINSGIAAAQAEISQAESAQTRLMEEGQFAAAARAASQLAIASAKLVELEGAKAHLEARRQQGWQQQQYAQQQPQIPADPVEAMAANLSPRSAAWVRDHRDQLTSVSGRAKVIAAHHDAIANEIVADTDAYFEHVEKFVSGRSPARTTTYVSKVGGAGTVRLTAAQVRAANDGTLIFNTGPNKGKPIGNAEMARRLMIQKQQGLLDKLD